MERKRKKRRMRCWGYFSSSKYVIRWTLLLKKPLSVPTPSETPFHVFLNFGPNWKHRIMQVTNAVPMNVIVHYNCAKIRFKKLELRSWRWHLKKKNLTSAHPNLMSIAELHLLRLTKHHKMLISFPKSQKKVMLNLKLQGNKHTPRTWQVQLGNQCKWSNYPLIDVICHLLSFWKCSLFIGKIRNRKPASQEQFSF